jgi:hypothetical protein
MFANQLRLLQFSELSIHDVGGSIMPLAAVMDRCVEFVSTSGFAGDSNRPPGDVIAYHEPNDLLTFLIEEKPIAPSNSGGWRYTNVVTSFAKIWIPKIIADPRSAHTGQSDSRDVMDLVAFGRKEPLDR